MRMHADLASSCSENEAVNAYDVADVPCFEVLEILLAYIIHSDIDLDSVGLISYVDEVSLAHISPGHYPACDADVDLLFIEKLLEFFLVISRLSLAGCLEGLIAELSFCV